MTDLSAIEHPSNLQDIRNAARAEHGEGYEKAVKPFRDAIQRVAKNYHKDYIESAKHIAGESRLPYSDGEMRLLVAALVELLEER